MTTMVTQAAYAALEREQDVARDKIRELENHTPCECSIRPECGGSAALCYWWQARFV